ncbi:hypothetical protein ACP6PL_14525 [Dapis sp. BLCC M126]|uniref:hypothetical protein n=1 Tax=Dapis sp. BLCC M126 TaxID=3400189 RepID=UPI003CE92381
MMKFTNILTNILIFKTAPILIGTVLVSSPSLAASFASSKGEVIIDGFSKNPYQVGVETNAEEFFVFGDGDQAYVDAFAEANFVADPSGADNTSSSEAGGTGSNFFALGESTARVIGDFSILPGETFEFDFEVYFDLKTSIDNSSDESANAEGNVSFFIFDTTAEDTPILLDFFGVSGNLETPGDNDFFGSTQNIVPSNFSISPSSSVNESFGGNKESISAFFDGSYQRTFDGNQIRNIRLVEIKANSAQVQSTPEPSATIAFILFSAVGVSTRFKSRINRTHLR